MVDPIAANPGRSGEDLLSRGARLATFLGFVIWFSLFGFGLRAWFLSRGGHNHELEIMPVFLWSMVLGLFRDAIVSAAISSPLLVGLLPRRVGWWWKGLVGTVVFLQTVVFLVLLIDVEFMRFYMVHMNAYVFSYLGELDKLSGSMGSLLDWWEWVVGFGVMPLLFILGHVWLAKRPPGFLRLDREGCARWVLLLLLLLMPVVGKYSYLMTRWFTREHLAYQLSNNVVFYMLETARNPKYMAPPVASRERFDEARENLRDWLGHQPMSSTSQQPWYYFSDDYAFVRGTAHHACVLGVAESLGIDCTQDLDGDGFTLAEDCDDTRADVYPGAGDIPYDRVDRSCAGIDSGRANIVLVIMESLRGVDVGAFAPWGALAENVTPTLDALQNEGLLYHNFYASGMTTARSVMAILCGTYPNIGAMLLRDYAYLNLPSISVVLRRHGYYATYMHPGDTRFDNKRRWLRMWFDEIHDFTNTFADVERVTSWGVADEVMFEYALQWADERGEQPFFMVLMPVTNHHPFRVPTGHRPLYPDAEDTYHRFLNTTHYSDWALGEFIEAARAHDWFEETYFIITSDHGQVMGEHGVTNDLGSVPPYQPSMWVPLFIMGPNLPMDEEERRVISHQVGSHVDLAPTIMDLLGIVTPHAFAGRTLLSPMPYERSFAIFSNPYRDVWVALRRGNQKTIHGRSSGSSEQYDLSSDSSEQVNLVNERGVEPTREVEILRDWVDLQGYLVFNNLFWDLERFGLDE